jgi:ribose 5-phosphate isomerase RpiB
MVGRPVVSKPPAAAMATVSSADDRVGLEHDDLDALPGDSVIGPELARELVHAFTAAQFSGAQRHQRRLAEVAENEHRGTDVLSEA